MAGSTLEKTIVWKGGQIKRKGKTTDENRRWDKVVKWDVTKSTSSDLPKRCLRLLQAPA